MSRTYKDSLKGKGNHGQYSRTHRRNISVRAIRREPPDIRQLSRAVINQALAQADAERQAQQAEAPTKDADAE